MAKLGSDVSNNGLGGITEFDVSIQVHLGVYGRVKAVEASAGIAKAYFDELTNTGFEGWEGIDSLDAVLEMFVHTIDLLIILFEKVAGVGSGYGIFRVAMCLLPGWKIHIPVIVSAW